MDAGSLLSVDTSHAIWDIREYAPRGYVPDSCPHPRNDDPCQAGADGDFVCP